MQDLDSLFLNKSTLLKGDYIMNNLENLRKIFLLLPIICIVVALFYPQTRQTHPASRKEDHKELGDIKLRSSIQLDLKTLATEYFPHGDYLGLATADGKDEYILDENGRTIMLLKRINGIGFTSFYSPLTPKEFRKEILCLPQDQQIALSSLLDLPKLTSEDIEESKREQKIREKEKEILDEALVLPSIFDSRIGKVERCKQVDQALVRGIIQKEYAITDAKSNKPIIGTFGVATCIALTVYDPKTKTAAIVHIDAGTEINSLGGIFWEIDKDYRKNSHLEVRLIGGNHSRTLVISLLKFLKKIDIGISSADVLHKPYPSEVAIDSRTGQIIPNIFPIDRGQNVELRMQLAGLSGVITASPIKKGFDGRSFRKF